MSLLKKAYAKGKDARGKYARGKDARGKMQNCKGQRPQSLRGSDGGGQIWVMWEIGGLIQWVQRCVFILFIAMNEGGQKHGA